MTIKAAASSFNGLIVIQIAFGVLSAFMLGAFPVCLFGSINQLQLFLLLPLLGKVTAQKVLDFDRVVSFALLSFYFIPVGDIRGSRITEDQTIDYLKLINIKSNSALANVAPVLCVVAAVVVAHLLLYSLCRWRAFRKWPRLARAAEWLLGQFGLGVYALLLLEGFVFLLLVSLTEVGRFHTGEESERWSLYFAFALLGFCVFMVAVAAWEFVKSTQPGAFERQQYFKCLFFGLRDSKWARSHSLAFLVRRALL